MVSGMLSFGGVAPFRSLILYHSRKLQNLIRPILRLCRKQGSLLWNPSRRAPGFSPHGKDDVDLGEFSGNLGVCLGDSPFDVVIGFVKQADDDGRVGGMAGGGGNAGKRGGKFAEALGEGIAKEAFAEFLPLLFIHGR